jgi:SAM-dependent methyltransferase
MLTNFDPIINSVREYHEKRVLKFGARFEALDFNSRSAQDIRFHQIAKLFDSDRPFSINDLGCGLADFIDFLSLRSWSFEYFGTDLSKSLLATAKALHSHQTYAHFVENAEELPLSDYSVASSIFNLKLEYPYKLVEKYVSYHLKILDQKSTKGFAFNMLTKYSDREKMQDYLYYADPSYYFDFCKTHFSRNVSLLHDYDLYDFTILVRK